MHIFEQTATMMETDSAERDIPYTEVADTDIAIIGMACRFPGSNGPEAFWQNLRDGVDLIQHYSDEELLAAGVAPAQLANPDYVKKGYVLDDVDLFDAAFFGMTPRDAAMLDPQHRLFLEHAWQALEHAGYNAADYPGAIGVFGGCGPSNYLLHLLMEDFDHVKLMTFCGSDYLPTRVSYKLNLRGPSVNVQTTCSTSLVAVHIACQSLLNGECHMALAGGVTIVLPQKRGYLYQEGMVDSPDGYCRAFDVQAQGLTGGSGVGLVLLKRLEEALEDGDTIHAVLKGSAINNDGALKMDYMAPSVDGQAAAISEALAIAGISPESISYVEAHGTATPIGDPIEIAALTQAFQTDERGHCAIGSLKTNIGHTDTAAGVGGLIKTVLALQNQQIPPSLHFTAPNPQIDFANSPFYVNDKLATWQSNGPRRAGVSSFGIGGTNAHVVLEEAPAVAASSPSRSWQLLLLSAKSAAALEHATANLANHLRQQPTQKLADVAYTLQVGRQRFPYRRALVCQGAEEAVNALESVDPAQIFTGYEPATERPVAFMFSGHGAEYLNMGQALYQEEPIFQEAFDCCCDLLLPHLGFDLRPILYPEPDQAEQVEAQFKEFITSQPLHFAFEYALAQLWLSWGVHPQAMIGHSSGEYVAACLAGVFTLEDGLALIAARGRCMQQLPPGAMLSLPLSETEVQPFLHEELSLALINGPEQCVVSGSVSAVEALEQTLRDQGTNCVRIRINYAAHSYMLDDILEAFAAEVKRIKLNPPLIPYVSNVTGTWVTAAETTDPDYWARHLRQTVRFADGLQQLLATDPALVLLEIGPGSTLSRLGQRQKVSDKQLFFSSVPTARQAQPDMVFGLETLGQLWLAGVPVDWAGFYAEERRHRLPLPTYPFERQRYWITAPQRSNGHHTSYEASQQNGLSPSVTIQAVDAVHSPSQPEPTYMRPQLRSRYVAPSTEIERTIAELWQEVLGFEQLGIEDSFFELGGDSLLATRVVSRLRETFQRELDIRTLFEQPTIAALAEQLEQASNGAAVQQASSQPPAIQAVPRDGTIPLSFAQQRLWFLYDLEGPSPTYNIVSALRLTGELDSAALEAAFNEVVRRHEALRTSFTVVEGEAVQSIAPSLSLPLTHVDLAHLSGQTQCAELDRLLAQAAQQPFDLTQLPLLRVTLYHLGPDDHVLLINIHHIIADGWTMGVLMQELDALYRAFVTGQPSPLAELPLQYADFACWQRQWLAGEVLDRQLGYWQQQLAATPTQLNLPTALSGGNPLGAPRPPVQTFRGATTTFDIAPDLTAALMRLSQEHEVSLFMTVYAALTVLLLRYSGQEDIVIGSPIANRNYRATEELIGVFINTLALRTDLTGNPTFAELLQRVRQVTLDAYTHQDVPFEQVVRALKLERSLSHSPLFQVLFLLHNQAMEQAKLGDLQVTPRSVQNETAKFDLSIMMGESAVDPAEGSQAAIAGKRLWGDLEYNTDLFDEATIQRLIGHFQTLLRAVVVNPEMHIQALPILTAAERHQLLVEWNATQVVYPQEQLIHQIIETQAARTPDALAVCFDRSDDAATLSPDHFATLTYRALNERSNQLAHHLQSLGVGPGTLVGICVERSLEMVVGLLGILKAGGAYVPLDPTYPPDRLAFMVADAQTPVLLTQARFKAKLLEHLGEDDAATTTVFCLDTEWDQLAHVSTSNPTPPVQAEDLAYMIYTSGSTGKPKGAMNTHANILNRLHWMQETYPLTPDDHILQKTPFSFDVSVWEFFWPLMFGAHLVVARPEGHKNPDYLVEIITQTAITTLHFVPSMLQLFVEANDIERCRSIKRVICSGEALPLDLTNRFLARLPAVELHNLYGPTEAAIDVSFWHCRPVDAHQARLQHAPIGRPVANTQLYILDSELQPVPVGVPGELHIGGVQVGRGYHKRPALTEEKFIANPFAPGRLYKTGDLSRFCPDGTIEFLGRLDHQVKIRGFRIELGEIEAALLGDPSVQEAVVVVRTDPPGHPRLFAYVVFQDQAADRHARIANLRRHLQETLPDYMVPTGFVALDALPLSPNGKVDRKALPDPEGTGLERRYVAPNTPTEATLATIWRAALAAAQVGIHDNFFELGGDSILAVRAAVAMQQAGFPASSKQLFQHQTIADLAAALDDLVPSAGDPQSAGAMQAPAPVELLALPPAVRQALPSDIEDAYPLSGMQALMLDCTRRDNGRSGAYHFQQSFHLQDETLSFPEFKAALQHLFTRHPALRSVFMPEIAGVRVQIVKQAFALPLFEDDISHLAPVEQDAYVDALMTRDRAQPFAIGTTDAPLVRFWLLRRAASAFEFGMAIHHAIFDGWGNIELLKELFAAYAALKAGDVIDQLPAPRVHKELVALEWEMATSSAAQQFWQETLLPARHTPLPQRAAASATHIQTRRLDEGIVAHLQSLAKRLQVPLRTVCLSAYLDLIANYSGDEVVTVGLIANGRSERLSDPLQALGLFWYMVPFCHAVDPKDKQAQVESVQALVAAITAHIHYPLPSILHAVDKAELFFATFNFVHFHNDQDIATAGELHLLDQKGFDRYHPPINMLVAVDPLDGHVDLELTYDEQYLDAEAADRLLGQYQAILER